MIKLVIEIKEKEIIDFDLEDIEVTHIECDIKKLKKNATDKEKEILKILENRIGHGKEIIDNTKNKEIKKLKNLLDVYNKII